MRPRHLHERAFERTRAMKTVIVGAHHAGIAAANTLLDN